MATREEGRDAHRVVGICLPSTIYWGYRDKHYFFSKNYLTRYQDCPIIRAKEKGRKG